MTGEQLLSQLRGLAAPQAVLAQGTVLVAAGHDAATVVQALVTRGLLRPDVAQALLHGSSPAEPTLRRGASGRQVPASSTAAASGDRTLPRGASERLPAATRTATSDPGVMAPALPPSAGSVSRQPGGGLDGRYRLGEALGAGGEAVVHTARDLTLDREVALKLVRPERLADPGALTDLLAEARFAGQLEHPGVVPVYEVGHDPQRGPFLAMKLVRGQTLAREIEAAHARVRAGEAAREAEERRLVEAVLKVCDALAYVHARGVLHRDLKAENVMVGAFGEVHVMDFGLARRQSEAPGASQEEVAGSPRTMAPEQAAGKTDLDERTDVYAVGALLFQVVAGAAPFGHLADVDAILKAARAGRAGRPSAAPRAWPVAPALEAVVLRAMAREPAARYAKVVDLAADLRAYLAGDLVRAHREGLAERVAREARRRPRLVVGATASAVCLGLGAVVLVRVHAAAAVREVAARQEGGDAARAALAGAARDEARAALTRLAAGGDDAGTRTGLALTAVQAAQRWYDLTPEAGPTPEKSEAARALFDAGHALGEVALATSQWDLAERAFGLERRLGVDEAAAVADVARAKDARAAEARRRKGEIDGWRTLAEKKELERARSEAEAARLASERSAVEANAEQAAADARRAEAERQAADAERERAETERQAAETQRQAAETKATAALEQTRRERGRALLTKAEQALARGEHREAAVLAAHAMVHDDGTPARVVWWRATQGPWRGPRTLGSHRAPVMGLAFDPAGGLLASRGWEGDVIVWDVASGRRVASFELERRTSFPTKARVAGPAVALSTTRRVAAATEGFVRVWDVDSAQRARDLALPDQGLHGRPPQVAMTPDGLGVVCLVQTHKAWELLTWETATGRSLGRSDLRATRAGEWALLCDATRYLRSEGNDLVLRAVKGGAELARAEPGPDRHSIGFLTAVSPTGWKRLPIVTDGRDGPSLAWWWPEKKEVKPVRAGRRQQPALLACTAGGERLAAAYEGELQLWRGDEELALLRCRDRAVSMAFSPGGQLVVGDGKDVDVWRTGAGDEAPPLAQLAWLPQGSCEWSEDGRRVLTRVAGGGKAERITVWDVQAERSVAEHEPPAEPSWNVSFATPDGRLVVRRRPRSRDQTAAFQLWNTDTKEARRGDGNAIAFSADGARMALEQDGLHVVGTWDGARHHSLPAASVACFATDPRTLAVVNEGVEVWQAGKLRWRVPLAEVTGGVLAGLRKLLFSPDDAALFCFGYDGFVTLDAVSGRRLGDWRGRRTRETLLRGHAFSSAGGVVALTAIETQDSKALLLLCRTTDGAELLRLSLGDARSQQVFFDPDGRTLRCFQDRHLALCLPVAFLLGRERTAAEVLEETAAATRLTVPPDGLEPVPAR